jgi:hypothetical protein
MICYGLGHYILAKIPRTCTTRICVWLPRSFCLFSKRKAGYHYAWCRLSVCVISHSNKITDWNLVPSTAERPKPRLYNPLVLKYYMNGTEMTSEIEGVHTCLPGKLLQIRLRLSRLKILSLFLKFINVLFEGVLDPSWWPLSPSW